MLDRNKGSATASKIISRLRSLSSIFFGSISSPSMHCCFTWTFICSWQPTRWQYWPDGRASSVLDRPVLSSNWWCRSIERNKRLSSDVATYVRWIISDRLTARWYRVHWSSNDRRPWERAHDSTGDDGSDCIWDIRRISPRFVALDSGYCRSSYNFCPLKRKTSGWSRASEVDLPKSWYMWIGMVQRPGNDWV